MARAGIRKIDEIVGPDGTKHPIHCNLETGVFTVKILDGDKRTLERFDGKDLEKVRADATEWIRGNTELDWKPILVIRSERGARWEAYKGSERSIDLEYERVFRATRKDKSFVYKEFDKPPDPKWPAHFIEADDDEVDGVPGKEIRRSWGDDSKILDYTPERWSALRMISVMIRTLNERIHGLIEAGTFEGLLETLAQNGTGLLLEAPKPQVDGKQDGKQDGKKDKKEKAHA